MEIDVERYGQAFAAVLPPQQIAPLGRGGEPVTEHRDKLDALSIDTAFGDRAVQDQDMARACISGAWLFNHYLDRSHEISQSNGNPTGSYWHGIMHRREPDYANSKYWFRKVGEHPIFDDLAEAAKHEARESDIAPQATFLRTQSQWDPYAFIDLVQGVAEGKMKDGALCRIVQHREFFLLFDYSYRRAIGE